MSYQVPQSNLVALHKIDLALTLIFTLQRIEFVIIAVMTAFKIQVLKKLQIQLINIFLFTKLLFKKNPKYL